MLPQAITAFAQLPLQKRKRIMQFGFPLLSLLTFLPVIGMIVIAFLPKDKVKFIQFVSVGVTALMMIMSIVLWMNFDAGMAGINDPKSFQFVEIFGVFVKTGTKANPIGKLNIE